MKILYTNITLAMMASVTVLVTTADVGHAQAMRSGSADALHSLSKPLFTQKDYESWDASQIDREPVVNRDGRYVAYSYRTPATGDVMVVESVDGRYKREFPQATRARFTSDGRHVLLSLKDSITVFALESKALKQIVGKEISPDGEWIVAVGQNAMTVTNAISGKSHTIALRGRVTFSPSSTALLVTTTDSLVWFDLDPKTTTLSAITVQRNARVRNPVFNSAGRSVAFVVGDSSARTVRYFTKGMDSARTIASARSSGMTGETWIADDRPKFSADDKRLFFQLMARPVERARDSTVLAPGLDVWHYRDMYPMSEQLERGAGRVERWMATVPVTGGSVLRLENGDSAVTNPWNLKSNRYLVLVSTRDAAEAWWNPKRAYGYTLVSLADGRRTPLVTHTRYEGAITLSPEERFAVWYDPAREASVSYEIATGKKREITTAMGAPRYDPYSGAKSNWWNVVGWVEHETAVLLSDGYDIWQVDLRGQRAPLDLTGGVGRREEIGFEVFHASRFESKPLSTTTRVPLIAFDYRTKRNGFWTMQVGKSGSAERLSMDDVLMHWNIGGDWPIRAANAETYLVQRQTASEAPNWFVTTDLRTFRRLTDVQPQRPYNWMTAELITWQINDSLSSQGILYKPENFDPAKRYPVIFQYYERFSDELHVYRRPELIGDRLDIPWYVSHGYLVFMPDFKFVPGHPGPSALRSIESAARHLMRFPWVDSTKLGLTGHSFGGYETIYLVTQSKLFAAANANAGMSDLGRMSGEQGFGGKDHATANNVGQIGIYAEVWERPDLYLENSPIFWANKVSTPLLLVHNREDGQLFGHSVGFFMALRRLQKPVWLLQYDKEDHSIRDANNQRDFMLRRWQFFEHYLNGAPAPVWMTQGIPLKDKGWRSGLEYDRSNATP